MSDTLKTIVVTASASTAALLTPAVVAAAADALPVGAAAGPFRLASPPAHMFRYFQNHLMLNHGDNVARASLFASDGRETLVMERADYEQALDEYLQLCLNEREERRDALAGLEDEIAFVQGLIAPAAPIATPQGFAFA